MSSDTPQLVPQQFFQNPIDVVTTTELSRPEKLEALLQWERDAEQLQQAAGEGMGGGEESRLAEVRKALDKLREPA